MIIHCTDLAIAEINRQKAGKEAKVKLAYDAEGCGCIMSGVPELWMVDIGAEFDIASDDKFSILYDKRHEVFFEEELKIDYKPEKKTFILKSNQQIYNSGMRLVEKRSPSH
jgi:uncharacterized protein YqkB